MEKYIKMIQKNPQKRQETFYKFGQEVLKSLAGQELEDKINDFWQTLMNEPTKWKGSLLIPEMYRANRGQPPLRANDVNYHIREDFMWSCLYKNFNHFQYDEKGNIVEKDPIKEKIFNLDSIVKNDKGIEIKEKNMKKTIKTGFTLEQKRTIMDITLIGKIQMPNHSQFKMKK